MKLYMAPLEGITTHVYRAVYHKHFAPMDTYFTPFLVPHEKKGFSKKEMKEVGIEENAGQHLVPQIMSNQSAGFLDTVRKLKEYGYEEVNLNLGCPSKTVVSKGRGSGFLSDVDGLHRFLEEIYAGCDMKISIKTRLGRFGEDEFVELLSIFNEYPVSELIIHPRVQTDQYKGNVRLEAFAYAVKEAKMPLCYNGDITDLESYRKIAERFPSVKACMLGRGLIANPYLPEMILQDKLCPIPKKRVKSFLDELSDTYYELYNDERNTLFKLKEVWNYMQDLFPNEKQLLKEMKKTKSLRVFKTYEGRILEE